ncbi:hypothetical protein FV218_04610 [Methylobacterium sp. WL69]|nr:hypothetical protein FV218_04610 [Methylobacterium sp. WL69]
MIACIEWDWPPLRITARMGRMEKGAGDEARWNWRRGRMGSARPQHPRSDEGTRPSHGGRSRATEHLDPPERRSHHHIDAPFGEKPGYRAAGREGRHAARRRQAGDEVWISGPKPGPALRHPKSKVEDQGIAILGAGGARIRSPQVDHFNTRHQGPGCGKAQGDAMAPAAREAGLVGHHHEVVGGVEDQGATRGQPPEPSEARDGLASGAVELCHGAEPAEAPARCRIVEGPREVIANRVARINHGPRVQRRRGRTVLRAFHPMASGLQAAYVPPRSPALRT